MKYLGEIIPVEYHAAIEQHANGLQSIVDGPTAVSVNPLTNTVYVANEGSNTVSVIDTRTNRVMYDAPAGNGPTAVSVKPSMHIKIK